MCGTETARTKRVLVDKTVLQVCPNCERFGKALEGPAKTAAAVPGNVPMALERRRQKMGQRDLFTTQGMQMELVEDFGERIKLAREQKGWTRQDLGGRIGEREVVVARFENGSLHPQDDTARKIERELGIKLFEPVLAGATKASPARSFTLGDVLRDAAKKKQGP